MQKLTSFLLLGSLCFFGVQVAGDILTEELLANKINNLGCHMLNGLYKDTLAEENILVSPVNAYAALALLQLGAGGKTREELATALHFGQNQNFTDLHPLLKTLLSKLPSKSDGQKFHETILANAVYLQHDFPVKDSYKEAAKKYYDAEAKNVDFVAKSKEATDEINGWISNSTKGRIGKFYDEPVSSDTVAVLLGALYFNAEWKETFSADKTKKEKFNTGSTEIETPMMTMQDSLYYVSNDELHYDSVVLPYKGYEYEMNVYLQHEGHGDHGSLARLYHELAQRNFTTENRARLLVDLKLPKMKFSWKKSLMKALRLEQIFSQPDLSEMTTHKNLKISNVMHAAELEVDEKGTVATAATALEWNLLSLFIPQNKEPVQFYVNRPFLVIIRHTPTKTNLFAGIVRKPVL